MLDVPAHRSLAQGRIVTVLRTPAVLRLASSCVGSLVAGLVVGGLGTRIVMRASAIAADDSRIGMVTENGNVVGRITGGGTLALVVFVGLAAGSSIGLLIFVLRTVAPARMRPLWVSLVLLAFGGSLAIDPGNPDFTIVGNPVLNLAMFIALFPGLAACAIWVAERFDRLLVQPPLVRLAALSLAGTALGAALGVLGVVLLASTRGPAGLALVTVIVLGTVAAVARGGVALGARRAALALLIVGTTAGLVALAGDVRLNASS
jgi:hypothetical protein